MTLKVVVLYPQPVDPEAFEARYHGQHMPLMRTLVPWPGATPTFKVIATGRELPRFYRMAELHFADRPTLDEFAGSDAARRARASAEQVSTGGPPLVFVCETD